MDLQQIVDTLGALGEEDAVNVMASVLKARPELAPPIVNFCCPDLTYPPSRVLIERRSTGTIKSFNHEKGFGFIDCPELHGIFGNDVFLHFRQYNGMEQGSPVSFAVVLNKDNKPQAFDLAYPEQKGKGDKGCMGKGCGKGCGKPMDMGKGMDTGKGWGSDYDMGGYGKGMGKDMGKDYGKDMGGWGSDYMYGGKMGKDMKGGGKDFGKGDKGDGKCGGKGPGPVHMQRGPDVSEELGNFTGTIKSFSEKNGYGFIDCPDVKALGHQDVFLHQAQKGAFDIGSVVSFSCYLNRSGKPNARDLQDAHQMQPMEKMPRLSY